MSLITSTCVRIQCSGDVNADVSTGVSTDGVKHFEKEIDKYRVALKRMVDLGKSEFNEEKFKRKAKAMSIGRINATD